MLPRIRPWVFFGLRISLALALPDDGSGAAYLLFQLALLTALVMRLPALKGLVLASPCVFWKSGMVLLLGFLRLT